MSPHVHPKSTARLKISWSWANAMNLLDGLDDPILPTSVLSQWKSCPLIVLGNDHLCNHGEQVIGMLNRLQEELPANTMHSSFHD